MAALEIKNGNKVVIITFVIQLLVFVFFMGSNYQKLNNVIDKIDAIEERLDKYDNAQMKLLEKVIANEILLSQK